MFEEVNIIIVLIDKELEKIESYIINNFIILYIIKDKRLKIKKVDWKKIIKIIELRVIKVIIDN